MYHGLHLLGKRPGLFHYVPLIPSQTHDPRSKLIIETGFTEFLCEKPVAVNFRLFVGNQFFQDFYKFLNFLLMLLCFFLLFLYFVEKGFNQNADDLYVVSSIGSGRIELECPLKGHYAHAIIFQGFLHITILLPFTFAEQAIALVEGRLGFEEKICGLERCVVKGFYCLSEVSLTVENRTLVEIDFRRFRIGD